MVNLEVPGATLYYETVGTGPLLLCVSGANGSYEIWQGLASQLKDHFTVVMYDRRGFSRSYLSGSQDYEHRIETDADDADLLIKHLSSEPAIVIGSSSGAMVALTILERRPESLRTLIAHEPPAMTQIPNVPESWAKQKEIYDTYRASGVDPAIELFAKLVKMDTGHEFEGMRRSFDPRNGPFIAANVMYWFERELRQYPFRELNLERLTASKEKLVLLNGKDTKKDSLQYLGNDNLKERLGMTLDFAAGAHIGYATHPKQFADDLVECLKKRNSL